MIILANPVMSVAYIKGFVLLFSFSSASDKAAVVQTYSQNLMELHLLDQHNHGLKLSLCCQPLLENPIPFITTQTNNIGLHWIIMLNCLILILILPSAFLFIFPLITTSRSFSGNGKSKTIYKMNSPF